MFLYTEIKEMECFFAFQKVTYSLEVLQKKKLFTHWANMFCLSAKTILAP